MSCAQRTPAGLPSGMPGIGDEIDGAVQHAPHAGRQSMAVRVAQALASRPHHVSFVCMPNVTTAMRWRTAAAAAATHADVRMSATVWYRITSCRTK